MSNLGQAALIIVGTVVGAEFGYAGLGLTLGALAGSVLFPTQLPSGPQLTDNRTTTANIGDPVPIVFGTASVAGTVIWLAPFVQSTNKSGKGGPSQTTYSYTQSIAIGLCERVNDDDPADVGAIAGLTRIWENGTIVYDIRPQQQADTDTGALAETDVQYANRLAASAVYAETFTLYLGDELQTADPTIEAIEGFGNAPAFRALAYIVYPNRVLQTAQGWRHPNFTFEVFQSGVGDCIDSTEYSNEVLYPWNDISSVDPRNLGNTHTYQFVQNNLSGPGTGPSRATLDLAVADGALQSDIYGWSIAGGAGGAYAPWFPITVTGHEQTLNIFLNSLSPATKTTSPLAYDPIGNAICDWAAANPNGYWTGAFHSSPTVVNFLSHGVFYFVPLTTGNIGACPAQGFDLNCTYDDQITVNRSPGPPSDPCLGLPAAPIIGYCIRSDGQYVKGGPWTRDTTRNYKVLAAYTVSGYDGSGRNGTVTQSPLNPCLPPGSASDTSAFWTAAYNAAVLAGQVPSGWAYGTQYPTVQAFGYTIDMQVCSGGGSGVGVADIITALCARAGLTAIDVTDIAAGGAQVNGYSISSVSNATNCIQPLRSIAFFDAVESATVLRFQTRGKPIVATLTTDDIGAFDGGSTGATVPPSLTVARIDETTLPRSIRLHYKSVARDYQDGQQSSPFRLTTKAINDQDVSLPFCMGDTQALQCAEVLWSDAWAGKSTYTASVDQSWSEIEVGDALGIPVDGVVQRARVISDQNSSAVLRKLSLVSDTEGAYISYAIAEVSQVQPQVLTLLAGTDLELLDLPALQDADSDPGFYLAAQRSGAGNAWRGCVIYKSIDAGSTWASQFSMTVESTAGTLHATPSASQFFTWDDVTTLTVDLASSASSLESRTDDAVLAGANAAAIGGDGRWEIVQFANATQLSATQWQLSRLLRGRRGTEHNIGLSLAGDAFVLLTAGDISRLVLSTAEIGAARSYDAPSIGASFSSGTVYPFAGHAQALKPFSPVDVTAELLTDGDVRISWTRRDRLGRTLMSGVDMPLSESLLQFQVDIYAVDSPGSSIIRTLTTSTTSCLYTAPEQASDFGASPPLTDLKVAVYQMSSVVGRGTPAIQALHIGVSP